MEFVKESEIQSIFYETPYFLEPQKSGVKKLMPCFGRHLKKAGKVGVGNFVMRNKEALCVLKPMENAILLEESVLRQEIRNINELDISGKIHVLSRRNADGHCADRSADRQNLIFQNIRTLIPIELLKLIHAKAKGKKLQPAPLRLCTANPRI